MKMVGLSGFFGVLLLAGSSAFASYEVRDPGNLLGQLDAYLNAPDFASALKLGDVADYTRLAKDPSDVCPPPQPGVWTQCGATASLVHEAMTRTVTAASAGAATITLDDGTSQAWTAEQYATLHGNAVRYDLPLLDFNIDGYLETHSIGDRTYTTPAGKAITGKEIVLLFHPKGFEDQTFMVRYTVMTGYPLVSQIIQMAAFGQWFYQLKDSSR